MTMTQPNESMRNGVDTAALVTTLDAVNAAPEAAKCHFRARNEVDERHAQTGRTAPTTRGVPMNIGDTARRTRTVEHADIERFTALSGDRNPLHYDEAAASRSRFGGIIVQGGVTSGLLNALVAEELPGPGSVFLHVDWSFRAPVRPGDTITAEAEVLDQRDDKPISRLRTTITNQDGVVVLDGTALVYREDLASSGHDDVDGR